VSLASYTLSYSKAEKPFSLSSQETSAMSANIDLGTMVRQAINSNSSLSMHEMVKCSDVQLTASIDKFAPESIPGLVRKTIRHEDARTASAHLWDNLIYIDKNGETLLKHASGHPNPGQTVGIIAGPDGGAIVLLNVLAGKEKQKWWTGDLGYSGQSRSEYRRVTGCRRRSEAHLNAHNL
jgi:hypothetical protein